MVQHLAGLPVSIDMRAAHGGAECGRLPVSQVAGYFEKY